MWILRLVGPAIFFAIYVYVCHQLIRFAHLSGPETALVLIFTLLPFAIFLGLPLFIWSREHSRSARWVEIYQHLAHTSLSYLSYIICFILLRDILAFFDFQFGLNIFTYDRTETFFILVLPIVCMFLGYLVVRSGPFVINKKLKFKNLPTSAVGKKIIHISDLHLGPSVGAKYISKVVKKANALQADFIVLTGDIFDGLIERNRQSVQALSELKAKEKIFYITGNHEYYWGSEAFIKKAQELGHEVLLNTNVKVGDIHFAGVTDPAAQHFNFEGPNLKKTLLGLSEKDFVILLAHQPNIANQASQQRVSLQLSGHTHAGQFLPWSLMIGLFQRYARGLYKVGNMQLYVNIGTGYWGPADRLGTFSEITAIELMPEK